MDLRDILINSLKLNLDYTYELVADLSEADMLEQPNGFVNHPNWTLGHLSTALEMCLEVLGKEYSLTKEWDDLFKRRGPGDPRRPDEDHSKYPSKATLLTVLKRQQNELLELLENTEERKFEEEKKWKFNNYLPTIGGYLNFMLVMHHSWHIGQLAEWRRMMNYDSALSKLPNKP